MLKKKGRPHNAKWPCISTGAPKSEFRFDFIFTLTRINDLFLLVEGGGRREKASVKGTQA